MNVAADNDAEKCPEEPEKIRLRMWAAPKFVGDHVPNTSETGRACALGSNIPPRLSRVATLPGGRVGDAGTYRCGVQSASGEEAVAYDGA